MIDIFNPATSPPPSLPPPAPPDGVRFADGEQYTLSRGEDDWQICGLLRSWKSTSQCTKGACHPNLAINGLNYLSEQWSEDLVDDGDQHKPNCQFLTANGKVERQGNCCAGIDYSSGVKLKVWSPYFPLLATWPLYLFTILPAGEPLDKRHVQRL